jgi:hypothetical protein
MLINNHRFFSVPQSAIHKLLHKDLTRKEFLGLIGIAVLSLTGIAGLVKQLESYAATTAVSTEPESGTLSGGAVAVNDTTASGGKAVKFGTGTSTGGVSDATLNALIASVGKLASSILRRLPPMRSGITLTERPLTAVCGNSIPSTRAVRRLIKAKI